MKFKICVSATIKRTIRNTRSLAKDVKNGVPDHSSADLTSSCSRCLAAAVKANKPNGLTDGKSG